MSMEQSIAGLFLVFSFGAYCGSRFEASRLSSAVKGGWLFVTWGKRYKVEEIE